MMQKTTKTDDETWVIENYDKHPLIKFTNTTKYCNAVFYRVSELEEDEYIKILLERDRCFSFNSRHEIPAFSRNSARNHALIYILHMEAVFEFQLHTVYLSLCYFDSFLSKISIDTNNESWAILLISIACLSLAAKMEEDKLPISLSEFQVGKYKFECKDIQRMELLVLDTMEWKMKIVTPFSYLPCFINKLCNEPPSQATSSMINKLILAFMKETNLMDHHQYAIAFAAILVALDPSLSREAIDLKINNSQCSRFIDIEEIFSCYNIMVQLEMDKTMMVNIPDRPIHVFHDTGATSSLCIKRKSLTFEDVDDQTDGDLCKKSRLSS
ncbi:Cyclin-D5-1 [Bienertia sinuspersici]